MTTQTAVVLVLAVVIVVAFVAWAFSRQRASRSLRSHFGPEYEREVQEQGRHRAERDLRARERRVEKLPIRPLAPTDRSRYADLWNQQQARFVDDPPGAVGEADHLVEEVMAKRGYPMVDFDQRAADISVDHPHMVDNYRTAHDIATRRSSVPTEDLRRAMVCYRALFEELLDDRIARQGA